MDRQQVSVPSNVVNLLDTLPAFRSLWPRLRSYNLQALAEYKLDRTPENAHDAAVDCRTLQQLMAFVPRARHVIVERYLDDPQLMTGVEQRLDSLTLSHSPSSRKPNK